MLGLIIIPTVLFMVYVYIHRGRSNTQKYLPSPFQIPVIGHLHLMRKYPKEPWKVFDELTREYGEIYKLRLGQCDFVIITGIDSAKDILLKNGNSCLDRPTITSWDVLLKDQQNGLHFANWSMLHQNIRKTLLEQMLSVNQIELDHFNEISEGGIKQFISSGFPENSLDFNQLATLYYRIILDYTCGTNFLAQPMSTDEKFDAAFQASLDVHDVALEGKIVDVFPFLKPFKFLFPQMRLLWDSNNTFMSFMLKEVGLEKMKHSLEKNIVHKGYLTGYTTLAEILIKKHIENVSNFSWTKCSQVIAAVVGGFVPMSMLTMVCLNYISLNKKYQEKIYQEIQEIESISEYEIIPLEKARKLVYIEAALLEVARLSCSPYLPRYTTENMVIKGYNIPKNTRLLVNVYSLNHSPRLWESPECFIPERFLVPEVDGSAELKIRKPPHFYPYGLGRRSCPGYGFFDNLAPLLLANLISRYEISSDFEYEEMSTRGLSNYGSFRAKNFLHLKLERRFF